MTAPELVPLPDGRRLAYVTYGDEDGTPLIFHHGTPGSSALGAVLAESARERNVRVVAPTRPGFGASDPNHRRTIESWADDCEALVDHLSLDSFAVVGFSGGGPYALKVAERLPNRVTAVGLIGSVVPSSDADPFALLARVPPLLGLVFRISDWLARLRGPEFVLAQLTDDDPTDETLEIVGRDFRQALESGPTGAVRESQLFADEWSLPTPDVPVRAWHGTADENVPIESTREAFDGLPDATLVEVEADHLGTLLAVREELVELADR